MSKPWSQKILLIFFTVVFGCLSWHFLSKYFSLGSLEARAYISKRPVVVQWAQYEKDKPFRLEEYLEPDTFANFNPAKGIELVKDPSRMPTLYVKGEEKIIFPVYLLPKSSGISSLLVRTVTYFSNPEFSLVFSMWLLGMLTFGLSLFYVWRTSGHWLMFTVISCLSPQIFFYIYSQYINAGLMLVLILAIMVLVRLSEKSRSFVFAGALSGLAVYTQLSATVFLLSISILNPDKIKKHKIPLLLGFLPFLVFILGNFDFGFMKSMFIERNADKNLMFFLEALAHLILDFIGPEPLLSQMESLQFFTHRPLLGIAMLLSILGFFVIAWKHISFRNLVKLGGISIIYYFLVTLIATEFDDDFYLFASLGFYFLSVLSISFLNQWQLMKSRLIIASMIALLTGRLLTTGLWSLEYMKTTRSLPDCIWIYSCMIRDWNQNNLLGNTPLLTLYFLEVGQIEFLSGEKIIPINLAPRYEREPTEDEVADFLRRFPHREFRILSSDPSQGDGRDLHSYLSPGTLESLNLRIEVVREYNFESLARRYSLLKVTRL